MNDSVVSVSPETPLIDVLRVFVDEGIHGAPVVDRDETLLGVITTSDLLRATRDEHERSETKIDYFRDLVEFSGPDWGTNLEDFQDRLGQRTAGEVMTPTAATVAPDEPVANVARRMREGGIHRVWVEKGGRICGVISAFDLLAVVEEMDGT